MIFSDPASPTDPVFETEAAALAEQAAGLAKVGSRSPTVIGGMFFGIMR